MIRATRVIPRADRAGAPADVVVLDFDARHRRRVAMNGTGGTDFVLDLPQAVALRDGDGLVLDDGRIVEVKAAPEPLVEITAPSAPALVRIAWHLGNRHLPTELLADRIRIRSDHVIEHMVEGLGGTVTATSAPFDPEGGAYAEHPHHGPDHDHPHNDGHGHHHG